MGIQQHLLHDHHSQYSTPHKQCNKCTIKVIEEPPNQTLFFLTTKNKLNVPQTIKSRTQHIHIPEPTNEKTAQFNNEVLSINEQLPYITPLDFLEKSPFERTIYIQSLPNETPMLTRLLSLWQQSLFDNLSKLNKREIIFLQKIIEIISNISYNFILKLQLLTATFILESEGGSSMTSQKKRKVNPLFAIKKI